MSFGRGSQPNWGGKIWTEDGQTIIKSDNSHVDPRPQWIMTARRDDERESKCRNFWAKQGRVKPYYPGSDSDCWNMMEGEMCFSTGSIKLSRSAPAHMKTMYHETVVSSWNYLIPGQAIFMLGISNMPKPSQDQARHNIVMIGPQTLMNIGGETIAAGKRVRYAPPDVMNAQDPSRMKMKTTHSVLNKRKLTACLRPASRRREGALALFGVEAKMIRENDEQNERRSPRLQLIYRLHKTMREMEDCWSQGQEHYPAAFRAGFALVDKLDKAIEESNEQPLDPTLDGFPFNEGLIVKTVMTSRKLVEYLHKDRTDGPQLGWWKHKEHRIPDANNPDQARQRIGLLLRVLGYYMQLLRANHAQNTLYQSVGKQLETSSKNTRSDTLIGVHDM